MTRLSIIIVTYNSLPQLEECLNSLKQWNKGIDYEVIVVDNNSPDISRDVLEAEHPDVIFHFMTTNRGFGAGCNTGFSKSNGEYILFLNPDTRFVDDSMKLGLDFLDRQQDVGAVSLMIMDDQRRPQVGFGRLPTIWTELLSSLHLEMPLRRSALRRTYGHQFKCGETIVVDWIAGACFLTRRAAFEEAGKFDEQFFLFYEDVDLCARLGMKGWRICYLPQTRLLHTGGHSTGRNYQILVACRYRSKLLYAEKYFSRFGILCVIVFSIAGLTVRLIATRWFTNSEERVARRRGYREAMAYCLRFMKEGSRNMSSHVHQHPTG